MALDTTSYILGKKAGGGSMTETDPIFSASPASGITASDITNWNNKTETLIIINNGSTLSPDVNTNENKAIIKKIIEDYPNINKYNIFFNTPNLSQSNVREIIALNYIYLRKVSDTYWECKLIFINLGSIYANGVVRYGVSYADYPYITITGNYNPTTETFTSLYGSFKRFPLFNSDWLSNGNGPIGKNNTEAYTPTGDYNVANKKYVDDSIASAITDALGGNY